MSTSFCAHRAQANQTPPARNRTRLHKPKVLLVVPLARRHENSLPLITSSQLITDPAQSTLQLTNQLRALGLYAAPTLGQPYFSTCAFLCRCLTPIQGDGNCLFRALADQLWGSPSGHLKLRAEVCGWMEARKERYEGFVDEDRSFDTHIQCMRIPGEGGSFEPLLTLNSFQALTAATSN